MLEVHISGSGQHHGVACTFPHFNPVKTVWSILACDVYSNGKQCGSLDDLEQAVQAVDLIT